MLAQLYAIRAQVDAAILAAEGEPPAMGCPHPAESRRDTTTTNSAGTRTFFCLACNTEVEGVA